MRTKVFLLTPLAWACVTAMAQGLPSGGSITQGTGSVKVNGTGMVVNQTSPRLIADWQSFSIGAGNSVQFVQPSSSSVALNRVLGSDPSRIFGSLTANGHVYLQNPNGVLFAPGAQVDVGSLVATTLNADAQQFMAGRLRLSGSSTGSVVNEGSITSAPGGYVVLAGPQVSNAGSIVTSGGTTALAAGNAVDIDPTGSGLLSISVPVAAVNAQLRNSGTISADGGMVSLQAAATDAALRTVMQVDGVVRARSIEQRDGQIVLSGGTSGIVAVNGTLDASGGAGVQGGSVKVLGDRVALLGSARVDASGGGGGGTVLLGGNYQGKGPEANAQATYVAGGALIDASAHDRGDGGKVVVWSDGMTTYAGQIDARGGATQGDGGLVEVSGKQVLNFLGDVDTRAAAGRAGTLLLDPTNLEIGAVANVNGDGTLGDDLPTATLLATDFAGANSQITAARVATLLATGNVSLQASNSMTVSAPLTVAPGGAASTLSMQSPTVNINAPITLNNASLAVDTNQDFSDSILVTAAVQSLASVALTSTDIFLDDATIQAANVTLTARNSTFSTMGQTGPSGIIANTLTIARSTGATSTVTLDGNLNQVAVLDVTANSATININNVPGTPVDVSGAVNGAFTLTTNTGVVQADATPASALVVGGAFNLTTTGTDPVTGAVVLTNPNNDFVGDVSFSSASNLSITGGKDPLNASGSAALNINLVSLNLAFGMNGDITSTSTTTPSNIDITGNGFIDLSDGTGGLFVQTGGRFFIRSSNYSVDALGPIGFGTALADVNSIVLGGWTGAAPATGNVYFTNAVGTIATPAADVSAVSKVYDGSTAFAYAQTGTTATGTITTAPGQVVSLLGYTLASSGAFADKNVGTDKAYTVAATNNVIGTGSAGEQYYGFAYGGLTRPAGPGTAISAITPRALTSTGISAINRVYDATTAVGLNTTAGTLNNVVVGDTVTLATAGASGTMADKNVGVAKAVAVSGLALTGADAGNYTVTDASAPTVTITQRPINAIGATAIDRIYDGTAAVALNTSATTLTGVIAGDTVTASGGSGTMADKNAGTAKPVTIAAVTLAGTDAGNYLATGVGTPTVDIGVRTITSTGVTGVDRVYDGTTAVGLNTGAVVLNNAVAGDAVTLNAAAATGTMSDKNVGTAKPVAIAGLTLSGADAVNYSLVDASTATVNISALALTPTGITASNRVVDGTTTVTIDASGADVLGVVSGDVVTLNTSGATGSVATPDPGTKPVFVAGLTLTGADAINYSILATPVTPSGSGLTVRILSVQQAAFEDIRYKEYLQGVSDAQEPFRRAMAEALASGFGKENIRKQLTRGLVFETGLAAPAVDRIEPAARPASCTGGSSLGCGK